MKEHDELTILQEHRAIWEEAANRAYVRITGLLLKRLGPEQFTMAMELVQAYGRSRAMSEAHQTQITKLIYRNRP